MNLKNKTPAELRELLIQYTESVDDAKYFKRSEEEIRRLERVLDEIHNALNVHIPLKKEYQELPEYVWQEKIVAYEGLLRAIKSQIEQVRYGERNFNLSKNLILKQNIIEDMLASLRRDIEMIGKLRHDIQKLETEIAQEEVVEMTNVEKQMKQYDFRLKRERVKNLNDQVRDMISGTNKEIKNFDREFSL